MESLSDLVEFALLGLGGGQICEILLSMMMMMDLGVTQIGDVLVLRMSIIIILSTIHNGVESISRSLDHCVRSQNINLFRLPGLQLSLFWNDADKHKEPMIYTKIT